MLTTILTNLALSATALAVVALVMRLPSALSDEAARTEPAQREYRQAA